MRLRNGGVVDGGQDRVVHAQGLEDALVTHLGERLAGDLLDHQSGEHGVGVRVLPTRSGVERHGLSEADRDELLGIPRAARLVVHRLVERSQGGVALQATAHVEQLGDGDSFPAGDVGPVPRHPVVQRDRPGIDQLQHGGARHRLGVRPDAEVVIRGDGIIDAELARAERLGPRLLGRSEQHDRGGNRHLLHALLDERAKRRAG
jgi:hypothetical protein